MSAERVIEVAKGELGVTEYPPGSNREEWRPVFGYESRYEVSNLGRVRNADGHILKPIKRRGYLCLNFCVNGARKDMKIHRLVAEAFIPNPDELPFVNHKDEDKENNAVWNLEWCTAKYNCNYGTHNLRVSIGLAGKKKNWSKTGMERLRQSHSIPVVGVHKITGVIIRFASAVEAGRNGFDRWCVQRAVNGHMKSYRGYEWHKEINYERASGY